MKYKLSKCQSPRGHALDQRTTKRGGSPGPWAAEQPSVSLLQASCPPLGWKWACGWPQPGLPDGGARKTRGMGPGRERPVETHGTASLLGPSHALDSRFLVLIALQTAHLARVHLGHVHVRVDHEFVLANAGAGDPE